MRVFIGICLLAWAISVPPASAQRRLGDFQYSVDQDQFDGTTQRTAIRASLRGIIALECTSRDPQVRVRLSYTLDRLPNITRVSDWRWRFDDGEITSGTIALRGSTGLAALAEDQRLQFLLALTNASRFRARVIGITNSEYDLDFRVHGARDAVALLAAECGDDALTAALRL